MEKEETGTHTIKRDNRCNGCAKTTSREEVGESIL